MPFTTGKFLAKASAASALFGASSPGGTSGGYRKTIRLVNLGSNTVYVGTSDAVATTDGFPIPANGSLTLDKAPDGEVWVIAASADQTDPGSIRYLVES